MSIIFQREHYRATLDDSTGRLLSFLSYGKEMLSGKTQPLLEIRMMNEEGRFFFLTDAGAAVSVREEENGCRISAAGFPGFPEPRAMWIRCAAPACR